MKRIITAMVATALTLSAVPALASDLIFPGGTGLTEKLAGQTYWSTQAQCAGLFGAASNYLSARGDTGAAEAAKTQALSFAEAAIGRLMKDRGLSRADALQVLQPAVLTGRESGLRTLEAGGTSSNSGWNYARSACMDVADIYQTVAR